MDEKLSWMEKLFLVEVDSLNAEKGCFASNAYFGEFFQLSNSRVSEIIKSLVSKDTNYRADIASTLGTRISNYLEVFSKSNKIEREIIDRLGKVVTDGIFETDVCYQMIKSIYNSNPNKFSLLMLNKDLVKYLTK
jgi:hypothetical protein